MTYPPEPPCHCVTGYPTCPYCAHAERDAPDADICATCGHPGHTARYCPWRDEPSDIDDLALVES